MRGCETPPSWIHDDEEATDETTEATAIALIEDSSHNVVEAYRTDEANENDGLIVQR